MFCIKCGAEIQDGTNFCIKCGNPIAETPAAKNPAASEVKEKPKVELDNRKLLLIRAAAIVIVILVLVLLLKSFGVGLSSPEKAFEAYLNGFSQADFDFMLKAYPDFCIEYNGGKTQLKEVLQKNYDSQVGKYAESGYQITYIATGHSMLDEDEVEKIEQDINEAFATDIELSAAATVDYQLILTHDDTEDISSTTGGYAVKYKGRWYYFNVW